MLHCDRLAVMTNNKIYTYLIYCKTSSLLGGHLYLADAITFREVPTSNSCVQLKASKGHDTTEYDHAGDQIRLFLFINRKEKYERLCGQFFLERVSTSNSSFVDYLLFDTVESVL